MTQANEIQPKCGALVLVWCALAAIVAGAISLVMLRHGIRMPPDAWTYWEAATSLRHNKGYFEFTGRRVWSWPPLYSLYLAGTEFVMGVSGRQLAVANTLLAAAATFTWTAAFLLPFRPSLAQARTLGWRFLIGPLIAVAFITFTIAARYRTGMSHNLVYVILPLVLYLAHRVMQSDGKSRSVFVFALVASLLVETHNSYVFLPCLVGIMVLFKRRQSLLLRFQSAAICAGIPVAAWFCMRVLLGQTGSHTPGGPKYSCSQYAHQAFSGVAMLCGPAQHHHGKAMLFGFHVRSHFMQLLLAHAGEALLIGLCIVILMCLIRSLRHEDPARNAVAIYVFLSCSVLAWLYVVFSTTFIYEDLISDRFLLFMPLTLVPAAIMLHWRSIMRAASAPESNAAPKPCGSNTIVTVIVAVIVIASTTTAGMNVIRFAREAGQNAGKVDVARADYDRGFAYNRLTIRYDYPLGSAREEGKYILVSPFREPSVTKERSRKAVEGLKKFLRSFRVF